MALAEAALEADVAVESPARVVWTLAWPAVLLNSLQVINTLLDRGFTGRLSDSALTGYGASSNVSFLMFSLGVAIATGATAIVSRAFGAQNPAEYRRAAKESLRVAIVGGFIIGLLTSVASGLVASLVLPPNDHEAHHQMIRYLSAYAFGLPALFVIQTLAGAMRGIGDTKSPMYISGIQIALHICLNFFLIFPTRHIGLLTIPGAGLGLMGAGCALSGSAWLSAIGYVCYVPRTPLAALSPFGLPNLHWALRILRIATPAAMMSCLRVLSLIAFTVVLKNVSDASAAIAALSISFAFESIMFMPAFGLSAAAAALVGQSLGMKRPERAERLAWTAGNHAAFVTICLALPIFLAAPTITFAITNGKLAISQHAALLLRCLCGTEFLFAYAMVMIGAMQGAGDTRRPLWITIGSLWGLRVPLALLLSFPTGFALGGFLPLPIGLGLGAFGAWLAMSLSQAAQGILAILAFRSGGWKLATV